MEAKVTKNVFTYGNQRYFRGKAENIDIGSFGKKKKPLGGAAYLAREANVRSDNLAGRVRYVTRAKVDWNRTTKADFESQGTVKYFAASAEGALSADLGKAKSADLELVKFAIDAGNLKQMLNSTAHGARKYLRNEGNDGRIVSEVWVFVDGVIADTFEASARTSGAVEAKLANGLGLQASASLGGSRSTSVTVTFEQGTAFAYLLHKVKRWNKDDTVAVVEDDRAGLG